MSPQQQLHLIERRLEANRGGIVLFHDTRKQTTAMLPGFIQFLRKGGYRLVHVVPAKP
jgi:peptidoglycan/xylan/chitin deacetylase (PgdA/CDA1 family)